MSKYHLLLNRRGFLKAIFVLTASCAVSVVTHLPLVAKLSPETTSTPIQSVGGQTTTGQSNDLSSLVDSDPSSVDNSNLPVTPIKELHVNGQVPEVTITDYHLSVWGMVENPLILTCEEIKRYPVVTEVVLLICPDTFVDNAEWTGVSVSSLLTEAVVKAGASQVTFNTLDGYKQNMPLSDVQRNGVFLAYAVDGESLPQPQGYPPRLVVKGEYGLYWLKWVSDLEIS